MFEPVFRKVKKNGVPILKRNEIDEIALGYIMDYHPKIIEGGIPFPIDEFVEEYLGCTIDYDYLTHNVSVLGMTVFNDTAKLEVWDPNLGKAEYRFATTGTILIDSSFVNDGKEGQVNFTMGHEAGHWIVHKSYFDYNSNQLDLFSTENPAFVQCRNVEKFFAISNYSKWDDVKWMEWQADNFSASLLMPKIALQKTYDKYFNASEEELVNIVSEIYRTSKMASKIRLEQIGIIERNIGIQANTLF